MATPVETKTDETKTLSADELKKMFDGLTPQLQSAVNNLNAEIKSHNDNVKIVRDAASDKQDPKLILQEVVRENPGNDPELAKKYADIEKLQARVETMWAEAMKLAEKYKPEAITPEMIKAAHESTKETSTSLRAQKDALGKLSDFFGVDLTIFLDEIDSTRGLRLSPSEGGSSLGIRPSYSKIFVVHNKGQENETEELISKEVQKKDGTTEVRSTTTFLAQELSKRIKGASVSSAELTVEFLKSQNLQPNQFDTLTAGVKYAWTFSKDVFNSENEKVGTKSFDLIFVK